MKNNIKPNLFCHICGAEIDQISCIDMEMKKYRCRNNNNHLFYHKFYDKSLAGPNFDGDELDSFNDDWRNISKILSDKSIRKKISIADAVILRRIYEYFEGTNPKIDIDREYKFCPICQLPLEDFESNEFDTGRFHGKKCKSGHKFTVRESIRTIDGKLELTLELPDDFIYEQVN